MTVKELKDKLSQFNDDEDVYIWGGNWPSFHIETVRTVSKNVYGSCGDEKGNTIYHPLYLSTTQQL